MALTIRDTKTTPRERRWWYPATDGTEISENSYSNLRRAVFEHYRRNNQPVPTEQDIIDYVCRNLSVPCYEGREAFRNLYTDPPSSIQRGKPSPKWPFVLEPLKLLAKEGDRGLGDIVERAVGKVGGDAYKKWYQRIFGRPCGCNERQEDLNRDFPL